MTLPSRHGIRNSSPGGLRSQRFPQYCIFTIERRRNILFLGNLKARVGFEPAIADFASRQLKQLHQGPRLNKNLATIRRQYFSSRIPWLRRLLWCQYFLFIQSTSSLNNPFISPPLPLAARMTRAAPLDNCDIGVDALTERLTASWVRSQLFQVPTTQEWLLFHHQRLCTGRFNNFFNISYIIFFWKSSEKMYIGILTVVISKDHPLKRRLTSCTCSCSEMYILDWKTVFVSTSLFKTVYNFNE